MALQGCNHKAKQGNCLISYVLYKLSALKHFLGRNFFSPCFAKKPKNNTFFLTKSF